MQQFIASDGARITYRDQGEGRPILLLHGLMATGGFFRHQMELARDFRLISVDLRGHGASEAGEDCPTVGRLAADISALITALNLTDAVGIGWSMGASVLFDLLTAPVAERF
ncbi:MAG TPA: alpha/beta hydrolase, partial [Allosphingosinicella sp.]